MASAIVKCLLTGAFVTGVLLSAALSLAQVGPAAGKSRLPQRDLELFRWVTAGDKEKVTSLLAEGANVKVANAVGRTPLHTAANYVPFGPDQDRQRLEIEGVEMCQANPDICVFEKWPQPTSATPSQPESAAPPAAPAK